MIYLLLIVLVAAIFGLTNAILACWWKRDVLGWYLAGFLLGIIGVIALLISLRFKRILTREDFAISNKPV